MVAIPKHMQAPRPADDLQAVYEKYNKRPREEQRTLIEEYLICRGDIESMNVLVKYGAKFNDNHMNFALYNSTNATYETIRFLSNNGAHLSTEGWLKQVGLGVRGAMER